MSQQLGLRCPFPSGGLGGWRAWETRPQALEVSRIEHSWSSGGHAWNWPACGWQDKVTMTSQRPAPRKAGADFGGLTPETPLGRPWPLSGKLLRGSRWREAGKRFPTIV